jgi:hypothetical protein
LTTRKTACSKKIVLDGKRGGQVHPRALQQEIWIPLGTERCGLSIDSDSVRKVKTLSTIFSAWAHTKITVFGLGPLCLTWRQKSNSFVGLPQRHKGEPCAHAAREQHVYMRLGRPLVSSGLPPRRHFCVVAVVKLPGVEPMNPRHRTQDDSSR